MIEGKTKSGFEFKIDERILDDWRLIEAIGLSDSGDASESIKGLTDTIKLVLGEQYKDFKKHILENNDGFMPKKVVTDMTIEIISTVKALKNSSSSEG